MESEKWQRITAKVALAIAIIRSKPDGKSSKTYTEELARHISNQDVKMKARVMELEAEVLGLRQELLLHKFHDKPLMDYGVINLTSEPLEDSRPASQLQEDSGCDVSNEDGVDALTSSQTSNCCDQLLTSLSSLAFPSNPLPIKKHVTVGEGQLSSHIHFLNHLLGLRRLTTAGSHLADLSKFGNDCSVIAESVSGLLNGLLSLYKDPKPSVSEFQTEAIRTVTDLLTNSRLSKNILQECMKRLEEFGKSIIQSILTNSRINRFQVQEARADCLYQLGKCPVVCGVLIHLLSFEIKNFIDELLQLQTAIAETCRDRIGQLSYSIELRGQSTTSSGKRYQPGRVLLKKQADTCLESGGTQSVTLLLADVEREGRSVSARALSPAAPLRASLSPPHSGTDYSTREDGIILGWGIGDPA
ncbi:meiosis-specific protein MEI4 isoform X1 [Hyperolius riggenbachi]|uniref:meiosis-specific protein MEI4 isoform X1 n=1 Tax=Hyperolius riggenbachi TaxID=752182 RepID=UPI0035A34F78